MVFWVFEEKISFETAANLVVEACLSERPSELQKEGLPQVELIVHHHWMHLDAY